MDQLVFIASVDFETLLTPDNHLLLLDNIETITEHGQNSVTVSLGNGFTGIIKFVDETAFSTALLLNTGSDEHVDSLNGIAEKKGYTIKEDGFYYHGDLIELQNEAELYEHLDMIFIPPELRENNGEIEAGRSGRIPDLIAAEDLRGIFHMHTVWSDGSNTIAELAEAARTMGMEYIGISDHSVSAGYAGGLSVERLLAQWDEIDAFNESGNGIHVFKGIESDITVSGDLDYDDSVLEKFDFIIASIHSKFNMSEAEATERIIKAVSHPAVTMLGHPTGRLLLARNGYPVDMERVLESCAEHGVAVELNANPRRLDIDWRYLRMAVSLGVKISINPDAHNIASLSQIRYGIKIARKGWLTKKDVFNTAPLENVKRAFL